jgi:hypothetical protein
VALYAFWIPSLVLVVAAEVFFALLIDRLVKVSDTTGTFVAYSELSRGKRLAERRKIERGGTQYSVRRRE